MVLSTKNIDTEDTMPQTVPSAGFTPPCDYTNFADNFDLSLLPGEDDSPPYLSPTTPLYTYSPPPASCGTKPKIYTTFYSSSLDESVENSDIDFGPDFQKLLSPDSPKKDQNFLTPPTSGIYLEVPSNKTYSSGSLSPYQTLLSPNGQYSGFPSPISDNQTLYPNSPELSLYPHSPSFYPQSPDNFQQQQKLIKKEILYSNSPPYVKEELQQNSSNKSNEISPSGKDIYKFLDSSPLEKQIKQESTVDFGTLLHDFQTNDSLFCQPFEKSQKEQSEKPKDHQLLRQALRDTSFQRRYNIKTFDFPLHEGEIKMEEPEQNEMSCNEELPREKIDPVLTIAIEHMKKDIDNTCKILGIPKDPCQWSLSQVFSWIKYTTNQFSLPSPDSEKWNLNGSELVALTEEEFINRISQGGSILYAQLEIWKASYCESDLGGTWLQEASTAPPSGEISDDEDDEVPMEIESKPSTSRNSGSSHIHLWQFLKELLASPQVHGTCIRWIDRNKGIFKIEDSVKVAKLWGKRKNRPAMNYDKLSRSIRQYYKKGIMKKTERSQRLVYQFCHPYNL